MNESPAHDPIEPLPRYALFRGRKVRIASYEDRRFRIIDTDDSSRTVTRSQLTFMKTRQSSSQQGSS